MEDTFVVCLSCVAEDVLLWFFLVIIVFCSLSAEWGVEIHWLVFLEGWKG